MADEIQTFFDGLAKRSYEPLLHSISGTFESDIDGVGSWLVTVKNGTMQVTKGKGKADCILSCDRDTFVHMIHGEQNPTTAFLQGKLSLRGDSGLAQVYQRLYSSSPGK